MSTDTHSLWKPAVAEGYEWALPVDASDHDRIRSLNGIPLGPTWIPLRMYLLKEEDDGERFARATAPWHSNGILILRDEAIGQVGVLLEEHGELLPLECADAELVLFHPCLVVDALDEQASVIERFPSGGVLRIPEPVFRVEAVPQTGAFTIAQLPNGPLLLTDDLVTAIRGSARLTGTEFRPVAIGGL